MADLMTHALVAFSAATVLSWRFKSIDPKYITAAMIGAVLPDLTRIGLIIDSALLEKMLDIPFSWHPLHTLGGVIISILVITSLVHKKHSKPVFLLLSFGAASHLFLDAFLIRASGNSYTMFFPISAHNPSIPGFYLSTDIWPVIITGIIAFAIWKIDSSKSNEVVTNRTS